MPRNSSYNPFDFFKKFFFDAHLPKGSKRENIAGTPSIHHCSAQNTGGPSKPQSAMTCSLKISEQNGCPARSGSSSRMAVRYIRTNTRIRHVIAARTSAHASKEPHHDKVHESP